MRFFGKYSLRHLRVPLLGRRFHDNWPSAVVARDLSLQVNRSYSRICSCSVEYDTDRFRQLSQKRFLNLKRYFDPKQEVSLDTEKRL